MDLDLQDLVVFLAVERRGSFGRAASDLLVTQPAVSERIRHLERVLGRQVFARTTRGATLTIAGEALLPYAHRCVALAEETVEASRQADGVPPFVIAVHSTFAQRIVPFVLGVLTSLPRRITVRDAHSEDISALVLDGVANVGFAVPAAPARGLRRLALTRDRVVCVASPDHDISRVRNPTAASLTAALIAVNDWGDGSETFLARLRDAGVDDWRVRRCADAATAVTLARDHDHVAFVAQSAVHPDDRRVRSIPIAGISRWAVRLDLLHRTRDRDDPVVRALANSVETA